MDALGEQLATRKEQLLTEYRATGIPKPEFTTLEETTA